MHPYVYPAVQDLLPALYGVPLAFDPAAIASALELLSPQDLRLFWISKQHLQHNEDAATATVSPSAQRTAAAAAAAIADEPAGPFSADVASATAPTCPDSAAPPPPLLTEPHYGAQYSVSPLPPAWLEAWGQALERPQDQPE
mgnify:CR=1 FL=1